MEIVTMSGLRSEQLSVGLANADTIPLPESDSSKAGFGLARYFGNHTTSSLIAFAQYGAQRLGHVGVVGISLIFFSIVASYSANGPLHEKTSSQAAELESLRLTSGNTNRAERKDDGTLSAQQLIDELPAHNDLPEILGQILTIATASKLSLDQGDYEFADTQSSAISSYRLTLPVRGSYPQVRQFIEQTLAAMPYVALEGLRVERNEISDQIIAADLEFAVLIRSTP